MQKMSQKDSVYTLKRRALSKKRNLRRNLEMVPKYNCSEPPVLNQKSKIQSGIRSPAKNYCITVNM